jgi:hypothetical protein
VKVRLTLLVAAFAGGCAAWSPPRAATLASLASLAPMPLASLVPGQFELELRSPGLSGTFDAVCAIDGDGLRLQLFPDVGGKVLDVVVGNDTITADLAGTPYVARAPLHRAAPHPALLLAAVVAELAAPIVPARVRGEREAHGGIELDLAPALGGGAVRATLTPGGVVAAYSIELAGMSFVLHADGRLRGAGFAGHLAGAAAGR